MKCRAGGPQTKGSLAMWAFKEKLCMSLLHSVYLRGNMIMNSE